MADYFSDDDASRRGSVIDHGAAAQPSSSLHPSVAMSQSSSEHDPTRRNGGGMSKSQDSGMRRMSGGLMLPTSPNRPSNSRSISGHRNGLAEGQATVPRDIGVGSNSMQSDSRMRLSNDADDSSEAFFNPASNAPAALASSPPKIFQPEPRRRQPLEMSKGAGSNSLLLENLYIDDSPFDETTASTTQTQTPGRGSPNLQLLQPSTAPPKIPQMFDSKSPFSQNLRRPSGLRNGMESSSRSNGEVGSVPKAASDSRPQGTSPPRKRSISKLHPIWRTPLDLPDSFSRRPSQIDTADTSRRSPLVLDTDQLHDPSARARHSSTSQGEATSQTVAASNSRNGALTRPMLSPLLAEASNGAYRPRGMSSGSVMTQGGNMKTRAVPPTLRTVSPGHEVPPGQRSASHAPLTSLREQQRQAHEQIKQSSAKAPLPALQLDLDPGALAPFSLWEYLKEEVLATDFDSTQEMKWERVTNFIAVPMWVEQVIAFGFVICLDSFLYTFTILPLRFLVAVVLWMRNFLSNLVTGKSKRYLHSSHKCDILKTLLVVLSCYGLSKFTDASKMYHSVRGQDVIKLYVIFNVMEILDRLCCSLGQDLLDALFSRATLARRADGSLPVARPLFFFVLALAYIQVHTMVLFYQLVTLNVAINSYDNALLTLLLSNQFTEIKGSVFKKFEKENLFQMTCADIVERFQLALILMAIGVRNLIEVSGSTASGEVPLPRSFTVFPSLSVLETSFAPVAIVIASECLVDWLKHAFITKFNHIRPAVYGRFIDVLCRDLVVAGPKAPNAAGAAPRSQRRHTFVDQSPVVSRRLGFAALPLACLLMRVSVQIWGMLGDDSHFDECAAPSSSYGRSHADGNGPIDMLLWLARSLLSGLGVRDARSWVDQAVDRTIQVLAWSLTAFVVWIFLVALKLLLGTFLISFASFRYRTMGQREVEEELNARDRGHIGVDKGEKEYDAKIRQLVEDRDKERSKPSRPVVGGNLMDVGRYDMVKSRLW